jgi:hypothetical protein
MQSVNSVFILAFSCNPGCTVFVPPPPHMASTSIPNSEIVGVVDGESRAYYVLGYGPFGDNSLKAAIKDALSKRGGDTLTNVAIDQSVTFFGAGPSLPQFNFGFSVKTKVYGTAVRYRK